MMKKGIQFKKLVLRKKVIGNLTQVSGGKRPYSYRECGSDDPSGGDGTTTYTSYCSVIAC